MFIIAADGNICIQTEDFVTCDQEPVGSFLR
jgi:hypothetical protein